MEKIKTKVRFTSLDVAAMVQNLQRLIGMRATNIYDLNPSTYVIKLAKTDDKALLLIENGVRFHTVEEKEGNKTLPSGFTMRFRKFLRSKRLEGVRQVGVERVVVFTFGQEAFCNHLILELYSQGNIILTDENYKILQCIRSHQFNDKVKTAVGEIYPFEYAAHIYLEKIDISEPKISETLVKMTAPTEAEAPDAPAKKKGKKPNVKKQTASKLRDIVFKLIPCLFPAVIDNILMGNHIDPDQPLEDSETEAIQEACKVAYRFLKDFLKSEHKGFLYSKTEMKEKADEMEYFEYSSYKNLKFEKNSVEFPFGSFDQAVAEYYSKYKKSQHQEEEQFEELAWKKFEQIKKDQEMRVKKLQEEQDIFKVKAEYIEKNIDDVEAIIKIIKTMESNGYSWDDIKRMVSDSRKNGDPLANMIHDIDIMKSQVTVLLGDPSAEDQYSELLPVEINIEYNAYTNATMYYSSKKKNYQKELRTKEASEQVLKIAEKDALKVIEKKKNEQFQKNMPARKLFWFEKFYWFISSEGILVISGRDSHQNELLVKRYMKPGDLYMHSDYGGAASTVIKINSKEVGAPRTTLDQAAVFTVCRSKAWDTKILSGAWWVYHDQVSKSAPTGEYLPTGSFMIRGKRNFVQPNRMEMGITLLFKVDFDSAKRHLDDRKIYEEANKTEKPELVSTQSEEGEEEYALITLETNTKNKGPKGKQKNPKMNKYINQPEIKANEEDDSEKDSENEDKDEDSDHSSDKAKLKAQQQKEKAKQNVKANPVPTEPKIKMRQKRKQAKLEKYLEEQDEEERQIIMKMIGAREMKHMATPKEDEDEQRKPQGKKGHGKNKNKKKGLQKYIGAPKQEDLQEKLNPDKILFLKKDKKQSSSSEEEVEEPKEDQKEPEGNKEEEEKISSSDEDKDGENEKQKDDEKEGEGKTEQVKEEVKEDEEVDQKVLDSEIAELFKLVGRLHPEDRVENLVTMCAPYSSIKENRFKVKLVPGGLKKGKAARNILHYFTNLGDLTEQEKPMIKSVPEQEIINALLGNVKMAGAGLLKLEMKEKADKKERKKESEKKERQ